MRANRLFADLRTATKFDERLREVADPAALAEALRQAEPELFAELQARAAGRRAKQRRRAEIAAENRRLIEAKRHP